MADSNMQKSLPVSPDCIELRIYNQDDRLEVSQILIKNGYQVNQAKRRRAEGSKIVDYILQVRLLPDAADTSR